MDPSGRKSLDEVLSDTGPPETLSSSTGPMKHASDADSASPKPKFSREEPKGRFVKFDGSVGGSGYDETTVEYVP